MSDQMDSNFNNNWNIDAVNNSETNAGTGTEPLPDNPIVKEKSEEKVFAVKAKFWFGFAGGLFAGVLVFAVIFGVFSAVVNRKLQALQNGTNVTVQNGNTGSNGSSVSGILDDTTFLKKIEAIETIIDKYFIEDVDDATLMEGVYDGLMYSLEDPYSCYYTAEEFEELMESTSGVYYGIGATVQQNVSTGIITIVKPFVDCPAYKAGMLPGDIIYKVEGKEVTGIDLSEVVSYMKGPEGTTVNIEVLRDGSSDPISMTVARAKVEVPTIEYRMLDNKIGYIYIMEFDEITVEQFRDAIKSLQAQGMKGLVIDIRDNPGGLLSAVCDMLDRLLPEGLIVYTEDKYGTRKEHMSSAKESLEIPMAVIINGSSASASEIFAGALQDYGMATIVGTQSFGKGIVQSIITMSDSSAVKLTVSEYFTPKGVCIHGVGITPDVTVDLSAEAKKMVVVPLEQDTQLLEAIRIVEEKVK